MGVVFGKSNVEEPAFKVLLDRTSVAVPYQIREYGKRIAVETKMGESDRSPFMKLAGYIGVVGNQPANEGGTAIDMTAPVVRTDGKGTKIAMTAPVVREEGIMQFILPAKYDSLEKAPKPTDATVFLKEIPPSVGAVKQYTGSYDQDLCKKWAIELRQQLREDGVDLSEEYVLQSYQFWGYNPPFTLPMFRRNEVWIPLTKQQAASLIASCGSGESSIN
ncbi:hypothetical protein FisN_17Lu322 [Fistulifera solaris]|uniref:SOUL heme-binding protein n=1 Tax=Fistulifera solaris TaxID=1519565 RepID=A0A1Z5J568_FISSO|nr:hypothetical protein FisN_17Lu322 [Fistulifera solaris]|eukprot:GAX09214.1 hypothetical protein FisN_17Lu322 [Fistulifera solaris]